MTFTLLSCVFDLIVNSTSEMTLALFGYLANDVYCLLLSFVSQLSFVYFIDSDRRKNSKLLRLRGIHNIFSFFESKYELVITTSSKWPLPYAVQVSRKVT